MSYVEPPMKFVNEVWYIVLLLLMRLKNKDLPGSFFLKHTEPQSIGNMYLYLNILTTFDKELRSLYILLVVVDHK